MLHTLHSCFVFDNQLMTCLRQALESSLAKLVQLILCLEEHVSIIVRGSTVPNIINTHQA